jgi:phosphotriesterase-related protein
MTGLLDAATPPLVQTVLGPISAADLGVTLMHEHTTRIVARMPPRETYAFSASMHEAKVSAANAWQMREDPYACHDHRSIDDEDAVAQELSLFAAAGGRTVVDNTTGMSRDPDALVRLAERTGLQLIMGSGWSLELGNPIPMGDEDPALFAESLVREHRDGVVVADGRRVRPGVIGEVQVGLNFDRPQRMVLMASAIAQRQIGVPLLIHLPGWQRRGHEVLDIVLGLGVDPRSVILCHMDPSGKDTVYQREIAARGVWLEFDMIGMPHNYPGEGQSPSVEDTVTAVAGLVQDGFTGQLLLSQDVSLKSMWTRHGGNGYAYVANAFLPRLIAAGVPAATAQSMLVANPADVFASAVRGAA